MKHKFITAFLTLLLFVAMPMSAAALELDGGRQGSVSVTLLESDGKTAISGVEFALYRVAAVNMVGGDLIYGYTAEFVGCGTAIDNPALPTVLEEYVDGHAVPIRKAVTDSDGAVVFSDLPLGLYFVKQSNVTDGYFTCKPFLVTVPYKGEGGYIYDVNASPKTEIARMTVITIKKVWNTDATVGIADYITVQLLRDGVVVETATLNKQNQWHVIYDNMPESEGYSVVEVNVPAGFTATYSRNGYDFTVTNTASLIQTGQLVWPIPVLALVGLMLMAVGTVLLRRARNFNG